MKRKSFCLSALVDFPDDACSAPYSKDTVHALVRRLKDMGVRRVYWYQYGDARHGFFWRRDGIPKWKSAAETARLVPDPLAAATEVAHALGMEIYAVYKPYENGVSMLYPSSESEAARYGLLPHLGGMLPAMMPFVAEHPELRIRRTAADIPSDLPTRRIGSIRIYKSDALPTRITAAKVSVLVSTTNGGYRPYAGQVRFSQQVMRAPETFVDNTGKVVAYRGTPVRVLQLDGLDIPERFVTVATAYDTGAADFETSPLEMVQAFDTDARALPISIGTPWHIWNYDDQYERHRTGLHFDTGWGARRIMLDEPGPDKGLIGIAKGKNGYLPTALCESETAVRGFWLSFIDDSIRVGVDGVDIRIENHSTHTDEPFAFGFNDVVCRELERRNGSASSESEADTGEVAAVRGAFFDAFLAETRRRLTAAGRKLQLHLNLEYLRPDPPVDRRPAYPWNIRFNWRDWIASGMADEVTARSFTFTPEFLLADEFTGDVVSRCAARNLPIHYNRYVFGSTELSGYLEDLERVYRDGRFDGFIVYETNSLFRSDGKGGVEDLKEGWVEAIAAKYRELEG